MTTWRRPSGARYAKAQPRRASTSDYERVLAGEAAKDSSSEGIAGVTHPLQVAALTSSGASRGSQKQEAGQVRVSLLCFCNKSENTIRLGRIQGTCANTRRTRQ